MKKYFKIVLILLLLFSKVLYSQDAMNKESSWDVFAKSVNIKYGDDFNRYKNSEEYKTFLTIFEKQYHIQEFEHRIKSDWYNLSKANIGVSDLKFYMKAVNFLGQKNSVSANCCLDTALALNPVFSFAYYYRARLFPTSLSDSAIKYVNKAIDIRQDIWRFYYYRSVAYSNNGNFNAALGDIQTALTLNPDDVYLLICQIGYRIAGNGSKKIYCNEFELLKKHNDFQLLSGDFKDVIKLMNIECGDDDGRIQANVNEKVLNEDIKYFPSDVDKNIPINSVVNDMSFVVIIANENYINEVNVQFAANDGKVFKEYCEKTLGIPPKNIRYFQDATFGLMKSSIKWISDVASAYDGQAKIIFYYAGHGIPNESDKSAYLLPADGFSSDLETAIKLQDLYNHLNANPTQLVTVFLDACFSGSVRDVGMLSNARGVKVKPKKDLIIGNTVIFTASSGDWIFRTKLTP